MSRWLQAKHKVVSNFYDLDTGGESLAYVMDDPINMRTHKYHTPKDPNRNYERREQNRTSGPTDKYIDPMYNLCEQIDKLIKSNNQVPDDIKKEALVIFNKMEHYSKESLISALRFDELLENVVDSLDYDTNINKLQAFLQN